MARNIGVAKGNPKAGGYVFRAPLGTALPTSASQELDPAFEEIALISSDGVVFSRSETNNDYRDWSDRVVHSDSSERTETANITYIESSPAVMEEYYGNATGDADGFYTDHDGDRAARVYVIDAIIGDDLLKRTVCPSGKVTGVSDVTEAPGNLIGYPCTYTYSYDASAGFTVRDYFERMASYTPVTPKSGDNPASKGWYELSGGAYVATSDTTADDAKTYYEKN